MKIRLVFFAFALAVCLNGTTLHAQVPQIVNYQGRVVVGSTNFNGTGQFKFALVDNANGQTLWSNDNTSANGSEPTNAVSLSVSNGLYSVLLGDISIANMTAIPPTVFTNSDVRLRVWFNDGTHGSQLLTPDQRIASVGYAMIAGTVPDLAISTNKLANNSVTSAKIDNTTVQQRVTGSAAPGQFIRAINADGTVVTASDDDSGGTVTSVTASAPLSVANSTTTPAISLSGMVPVANGGTGATTLSANGVLLGNGTSAVTATGALTNGQLVIGRTGLAPTVGTLTGTPNQINVTNGSGTITLSLATNAGTDISANLEEESQIGSTSISDNSASGEILLGSGTNSASWVTVSGDLIFTSGGTATIQPNAVTLGTDTTGIYVASVGTDNGLTGGAGSSEGAVLTLGLDYSSTLASNTLVANQTQFASTGIIFEGSTANTNEGLLTAANPGADRTWTLPDATGTVITTGNLSDITSVGVLTQLSATGAVSLGNGAQGIQISSNSWDVTASGDITTPGSISTSGTGQIVAAGLLTASGGVRSITSSATAPAYSFTSDTNTGMYSSGADTLEFSTGGTARLSLNSAGAISLAGPMVLVPQATLSGSTIPITKSLAVLAASGTAVNNFSGGTQGQVVFVVAVGSVTVNDNDTGLGNIKLGTGGNFAMTADDTLQLIFDGSFWLEVSRSVN